MSNRLIAHTVTAVAAVMLLSAISAPISHAAPPTGPIPSVYSPLSESAAIPSSRGIDRALGSLPRSQSLGAFSMTVVDPVTERVIFTDRVNSLRVPASVAKVLTAAASLSALGPQYRVTTPVKNLGDAVYLVGAGDPLMPRASGSGSLKQLAQLTAAALKRSGKSRTNVIFDDSLFSGPALGPGWKTGYPRLGVAAPVSALSVGGARVSPGAISRTTKPARQAADLFAQRLRNQGIKVKKIQSGKTPTAATTIASVQSRPISELVELMVRDSDNDVAEILARLVGLKINGDGSFTGGSRAITSVLATKGIDTSRLKVADGSGLSTKNKVTVGVVAAVLTEMVRGDQAQWASIATGLPIAAETGTLENRFNSKGTRAGAGVVLAKTGSLTGVSSLAGTVKDRSGRLLVFVLMSNKITSIPSARNTMDRIAATLAKCGCTE